MSYSVVVEDLTRRFGGFTAVDSVSFEVSKGEIFGFLGSNGAGKTTTIRMLCGILPPTRGKGTVLGMDIVRERNTIKERIGYMSQKFSLYNDLTVKENLEFFAGMYSIAGSRSKTIKEALETTGLQKRADTRTEDLPFGIKQRLAFASAMLHHPPIVFLDEPTAGVDPAGRREFWELINEVAAEGVTVFVTTHYMDEAEYCHRIVLMHEARLRAIGTPAQLKRDALAGVMQEITCSNPARALGLLKSAKLGETARFGNKIHVNVENEELGRAAIEELLTREGVTVTGLERVQPSLEDVFINVLSRPGEQP